MKTSTKNVIKLVVAAISGYALLSSVFSFMQSETSEDLLVSLTVIVFYFLITAALLFSVYRSNKKQRLLNEEDNQSN